ncbi:hypothetical protein KKF86_05750 [bacterium]|nr:hypothetical protein [bacterium]
MEKTKLINRTIGMVGIIISIILLMNYTRIIIFLTQQSKIYLSQDHNIGPKSILMIKIFTVGFIVLIITVSIILLLTLTKIVCLKIQEFFQLNNPFINNNFLKKRLDIYILVIGTLLVIFEIFWLLAFGETFDETAVPLTLPEGKLEIFYAYVLLFSIIILAFSIKRASSVSFPLKIRRKILFMLIAILGILIMIFGEEISWGQQIFKWDSFGFFKEYSYQNETNLHNIFNPFMKYLYPIVGSGSFIFLFLIWLFPSKRNNYLFNLIFPHPSLFFLVLILAVSSFLGGGGETFEQLLTLFALLYSVRIFLCLRFPNLDLLSRKI